MKKYITIIVFIAFTKSIVAQTVSSSYDSLGRLTQVIYPDSSIIKYVYDASGNRMSKKIFQSTITRACPQSIVTFFAGLTDTSKNYQWQADTASGFYNLTPGAIYSGVDSSTLSLYYPPTNWYNHKYRCLISDSSGQTISPVFTLKFEVSWIGVSDTAWENTANWGCGLLPDGYTDVIIRATAPRFPHVNSNVFCRSISLQYGAAVSVKTGYTLVVTH